MNIKGFYSNVCQKCWAIGSFAVREISFKGAKCMSAVLQSLLTATNVCSNLCIADALKASTICRFWSAKPKLMFLYIDVMLRGMPFFKRVPSCFESGGDFFPMSFFSKNLHPLYRLEE